MKKWLLVPVTLLTISAMVLLALGCSNSTAATSVKTSVATVQKGSLSVAVTGTGNLAYSSSEDLAFEVAGYVAEILVKEGESVTKGQELAKLDTSEWDKQVKALEKALVAAQRSLTDRERALTKAELQVTTKESAVARAERQVSSKELAVRQVELDLETAQDNVRQIAALKTIQDDIDNLELLLKAAKMLQSGQTGGIYDVVYLNQQMTSAQDRLADARKDMQDILSGANTNVSSDVARQVARYNLSLEQSQRQVEDARITVEDARLAVNDALLAVEDAKSAVSDAKLAREDAGQAVLDAQSALDEAKSLSPIITAPFDGYIPKINAKGGDEIFKGTVAMQIADPSQFEAVILVSEKNISSLKVGQNATVTLEAVAGATYSAAITKIAPLATASQGVVNYQVTVKLASSQPVVRNTAAQSNQTVAQSATLKSGLSAVVTIVIQQKDNVLKVPNRAITRQGQDSTVEVVTADGTETRVVKTGMSDNSNTEITEGLSEGEQVVIKATTSTTSKPTGASNTQQAPPAGGPGLGGILR